MTDKTKLTEEQIAEIKEMTNEDFFKALRAEEDVETRIDMLFV